MCLNNLKFVKRIFSLKILIFTPILLPIGLCRLGRPHHPPPPQLRQSSRPICGHADQCLTRHAEMLPSLMNSLVHKTDASESY